jgi:hypothetical protein
VTEVVTMFAADDSVFALWLLDDVQGDPAGLVRIADSVGRHMTDPAAEPEEFSGNAWVATVSRDGVDLENLFNDVVRESLPLPDAAAILKAYWDHLRSVQRPGPFDKAAAKFTTRAHRPPVLPWEVPGGTQTR